VPGIEGGNRSAYLEAGDCWLCLSLDRFQAQTPRADYTHYGFLIAAAEFPAFVAGLRARGVRAWKTNSSEGESCYVLDPDGHKLEIHVGSLETRLADCLRRPYRGMEFFD
jgi:catechol 2,3-dioxygenase-like lactoylglutathione lyase family enzyme